MRASLAHARAEAEPRGLAPTREVLPNGVTVIAKETRTTPAVTLHANVRAGSACDPLDLGGLSHFVSRTLDRGTDRRSTDEIAEMLDSRGVTLSATVSRHVLSLACTCLVEHFDEVLSLLAEIVMRPAFDPLEVERRRGEIITLIRQDEDNPATVAVESLLALLHGTAHPYGRRPRGSVEAVERIDSAALRRFHASCFVPSALSLAFVGDLEPERAVDAARSAFGSWEGGQRPALLNPPARETASRTARVVPMMNKAQADIAYGFATIPRSDPSYHSHWLMNNILGEYSLGGRLGDRIREQQGMAYYVFSSFEPSLLAGSLVIRAGVSPSNVEKAVASIDAELARLLADGPTEQELFESKQYLIGSLPRTLETNMGIANYLQTLEFFDLGLDYDVRLPHLLHEVTIDDVRDAARRSIDPGRAAVVVAGPYRGTLS